MNKILNLNVDKKSKYTENNLKNYIDKDFLNENIEIKVELEDYKFKHKIIINYENIIILSIYKKDKKEIMQKISRKKFSDIFKTSKDIIRFFKSCTNDRKIKINNINKYFYIVE